LGDCPTQDGSPALLEARAVLYAWLRSHFGEAATVEKQLADFGLPRPVDCWAERQGRRYAYWLIERRLPWQEKEDIRTAVLKSGASLTWVLLSAVLRRLDTDAKMLKLSTTERSCMARSDFDSVHQLGGGCTLHYLDAGAKAVITFRAVACVHDPQIFAGQEVQTPLGQVRVYPKTGEFVHPGEYEKLEDARRKLRQERERWRSLGGDRTTAGSS
jgi:hypothetical protein